jgi:protein TonB
MEITKILSADLLDILFEGRNKSYGAYELRKSYNKRLTLSLAVMFLTILLLWAGYLLANKNDRQVLNNPFPIVDSVVVHIVEQPVPELPPLPPPPAAKLPELPKLQSLAFTSPPRIVNEEVPDNERPPAMTDMVDVKIGTINNPDGQTGDFVTPPDGEGTQRGIIAGPPAKRDNLDSLFITVQIESEYPGGKLAWTRFLHKNMGAYPQEAIDQQIQGQVVIQFIVDREGNVSNIEALSGPKELWEVAIRAVKKSGKWIPAEQNGSKVKSYKRQPVTFQLPED